MLQWTEAELRAMREADAEIDAQSDDLYPGLSRHVESIIGDSGNGKKDRRAYKRAYYHKNREKIKAKGDYMSPEARRAYNKAYYQKNRERIREQARIRWKTDAKYREDIYRRKKRWTAENREHVNAYQREAQRRYRAQRKEAMQNGTEDGR